LDSSIQTDLLAKSVALVWQSACYCFRRGSQTMQTGWGYAVQGSIYTACEHSRMAPSISTVPRILK